MLSPWARIVILAVFIEASIGWGAFAYVGADLHLRFGLSFAAIGLIVGTFGIGGLIYAASVQPLVDLLGATGFAILGGGLLGLAYLVLAIGAAWWLAPIAVTAIGLGFYALHNTLQTNATQMTPQARHRGRDLLLGDLSRSDAGRRGGGAGVRPLHRGAVVPRDGDRTASAGVVVCREAEAACKEERTSAQVAGSVRPPRYSLLSATARDPFDLGPHQALDHSRQIVVEPGLEHRPQHLPHQVLERAAFCTSTVWASVLNAESTAALVAA